MWSNEISRDSLPGDLTGYFIGVMLRLQQQRPPSGGSEAELDTLGNYLVVFRIILSVVVREDLAVLQRKLRISEENKKSYSDQAHNILRKQR